MKPALKLLAAALSLLVVGGLFVSCVGGMRGAAARMKCQNHLRQLSVAMDNYHSASEHYPPATIPGAKLPPDERLSWLVSLKPYMESAPRLRLDPNKPWDHPDNYPPREGPVKGEVGESYVGRMPFLNCPVAPPIDPDELAWPTHYVGVAGVGPDAALLPTDHRRAGVFGHDRKARTEDVKDGLETTAALIGAGGGPWTAGGEATLGVVADGGAYFGKGSRFVCRHRDTAIGGAWGTHVAFLDGSVRVMTAATSGKVFEAHATIAAGD